MGQKLLWCDVETTGLNPLQDFMLEIALVVTEDFQIIDEITLSIKYSNVKELKDMCTEKVVDMHTKNSLWEDLEKATLSLKEVEAKCVEFVEKYFYRYDIYNKPVLAGSNPGFDKDFLEEWLPELHSQLHYRTFDMNALYIFFGSNKDTNVPRNHRALGDLYADIISANSFLDKIK